MNITLDEINRMYQSATDMVAEYRKDVINAVNSPATAARLAELVNRVAEAEGAFAAIERVKKVLDYNDRTLGEGETASWREYLVERLAQGADDDWSGRINDNRRAWFEGFRKQAARLLDV